MKILITGSEGTLGKVLRTELESRGHTVYGIDMAHSSLSTHTRCDIREVRQVEVVFSKVKPDVVYHLAAEFGRMNGEHYYEQLWSSNQIGTANIIKACTAHDARLILAGSSEAYGDTGLDNLTENWLDNNIATFHNQYALSKWVQERQIFIAAQNEGLKAVVLRFFNAYGPGELYNDYRSVVCLFTYRMLFDIPLTVYKNYHRVFMYVADWARTVANVAEKFDTLPAGDRPSKVPVYNIGGTEYRSVEELVDVVRNTWATLGIHSESPITLLDAEIANVTNKRPDLQAAIRDLDHQCTVNLELGVAETAKWMLEEYWS